MVKRNIYVLLTLAFFSPILHAEPNDSTTAFLGKWKLDPSRGRLTDQMRVESLGPNRYNLIFSGDNVETVVADGTDQPGLYGTSIAIIVRDANNWKVVRKTNGRTTIVGLWELSPDGRTLTDNFTGYVENGTTTNLHYIYQRIVSPAPGGATSGFAGTWESTTEDVKSSYEIEIKPFQAQGLSFINSAAQITQSLQFDGKDYPGLGTNLPAGYASSGRRMNDHTVERVDKINGKVLYTQQFELSPDGKILTVTVHIPGRDKPNVMVFNRE